MGVGRRNDPLIGHVDVGKENLLDYFHRSLVHFLLHHLTQVLGGSRKLVEEIDQRLAVFITIFFIDYLVFFFFELKFKKFSLAL